jgi:hypothetical protein
MLDPESCELPLPPFPPLDPLADSALLPFGVVALLHAAATTKQTAANRAPERFMRISYGRRQSGPRRPSTADHVRPPHNVCGAVTLIPAIFKKFNQIH